MIEASVKPSHRGTYSPSLQDLILCTLFVAVSWQSLQLAAADTIRNFPCFYIQLMMVDVFVIISAGLLGKEMLSNVLDHKLRKMKVTGKGCTSS